jgi:hypothetical protein
MHAEELKYKRIGPISGIFVTLGLVFGVLGCVFVASFLQYWLHSVWPGIILIALVMALAFFIVKTRLTDYIYLIEKDRITFGRRVGKREKELLFVPFRDIRAFGPYEEIVANNPEQKKRYKFTFKKRRDWYAVACADCLIILSPTREYLDCLKEAKKNR